MKITKEDLITKSVFVNDEYSIRFDKENRLLYLTANKANIIKIYSLSGDLRTMIVIAKDKKLGVGIDDANKILQVFGFELEV